MEWSLEKLLFGFEFSAQYKLFFAIFTSDVEKIKSWKLDLLELQSSEDIEISPEEVKEMVTEAKKAYPYTFYNSNIPPDHDLRVVKVVYMCSSVIQLPHESHDLSQAEKRITCVKLSKFTK